MILRRLRLRAGPLDAGITWYGGNAAPRDSLQGREQVRCECRVAGVMLAWVQLVWSRFSV